MDDVIQVGVHDHTLVTFELADGLFGRFYSSKDKVTISEIQIYVQMRNQDIKLLQNNPRATINAWIMLTMLGWSQHA